MLDVGCWMLESPMTSIKNKDKPFDVLEAGDVNDDIACYNDSKLLQLKSAVKLQSCWIIG